MAVADREQLEQEISASVQQELLKHPGKWAAITRSGVLAIGTSPRRVIEAARRKGVASPILYRIPDASTLDFSERHSGGVPRIEGTQVSVDGLGHEVCTLGGGARGPFEPRALQLTLSWQGWTYSGEMRIAEPKHLPVVLLGRGDFFREFVVRFNWHKSPPEFHLDPVAVTRKR